MSLAQVGWLGVALVCGALPFSVWIGRYGLRREIRNFGDHNPGAMNVYRASHIGWFGLALFLDISKAAAPVGLARNVWGWDGLALVAMALAPAVGHAYSPWLGFRGGKAIAAMFGTWIGLTGWVVSLPAAFFLVVFAWLIEPPGWAVLLTIAALAGYLAWQALPVDYFLVLAGQLLLSLIKQQEDLRQRPTWRRRRGHG